MMQASTYGATIPLIMGRTKSPLLAIWAQNLREGPSGKKGKGSKKGGPPSYIENIDFLLGHNPILGILQCWQNSTKYPLTFTSQSFGVTYATQSVTVTDPNFVAVVGVTKTINYSYTFNDYGGSPSSGSGSYACPCWNEAVLGPDPTSNAQWRNWPCSYRWQPSYGATVYLDTLSFGSGPTTYTVYYAALPSGVSTTPAAKLRLSFENILGSGSEYSGYSAQQIQYPWYAGAGSPNLDLGDSGAIPALRTEILGKYSLYSTGDADFVDMIEEIIKSGMGQAAIDGSYGLSPVQRGVAAYDFPGPIQMLFAHENYEYRVGATYSLTYGAPNTAGSILVAIVGGTDADTDTINGVSDTLNGAWTQAVNYHNVLNLSNRAVFYFVGCAGGSNTVTVTMGGGGWDVELILLEISGVDTFDGVSAAQGAQPAVSITTTNDPGSKAYLLAVSLRNPDGPAATLAGSQGQWPLIFNDYAYFNGAFENGTFLQGRIVSNPGTYALQWLTPSTAWSSSSSLVLLSFKATSPPTYAAGLTNILDADSKELTRLQCRAGGLWGSLSMDAQQAARDWLNLLCQAANCAPVWTGFKLKLIPRSEVSNYGNGAVYYSPTAPGPVANLSTENGDLLAEKGVAPITVVNKARTDVQTVLQMQHLDRSTNYNQVTTAEPDPAGIAIYGVRKADPVVNNAVHDIAIARALLRIALRRQNYVANTTFKFKANARFQLLEAMDLITLTDPLANINALPVRLTKVEEQEDYSLDCEAEPFIYGIHAPENITVTYPAGYSANVAASAGNVNTPVIFEPVARLSNNLNQLWFAVSSSNAAYGGCQVWISTDGGNSYPNMLGTCLGNATTGLTVGDWPAHADPDTTEDLAVNLTESLGALASYQVADENNFTYPCYVAGGTALTPYELMTYAVATLTSTYNYTLKATGGGTNQLRRAVFGAPGSAGVDHPSGSRFVFLLGEGVLKVGMDPSWIGKTLYFKFLSFNTFGAALQSLSDVSPVTYTPIGTAAAANANWQTYSVSPAPALSQPVPSPYQINMAQATATFLSNTVNYNARTFSIADPGVGNTATYYVTIADPGLIGDTGSSTNLTATCQTSSALVGVAGNTFIGLITVTHTGGASAIAIQGGMPLPAGFLVNGA
jgi:hypothetical protein